MLNLLKQDLYRLYRDFTLKLALILSVGLSLLNLLVYALLGDSLAGMYPNHLTIVLSGLSPVNNAGLVILIILPFFAMRDFSFNTIRNKINLGYQRYQIYLSMMLVMLIYGLVVIILATGINFISGLICMPSLPLSATGVSGFVRGVVCGITLYATSFIIITASIFAFRRYIAGLSIVFILSIVTLIFASLTMLVEDQFLQALMQFSPVGQINALVNDRPFTTDLLYTLAVFFVYSGTFAVGGYLCFHRADLK